MNAAKKLALIIGFFILLGIACVATGCADTSSVDGRETYVLGFGRISEGRRDGRTVVGESAGVEARRPVISASNTNVSSDSLRAVWGASEKGGN
jgi:hypothetical protein